jgi:hypothetical protein
VLTDKTEFTISDEDVAGVFCKLFGWVKLETVKRGYVIDLKYHGVVK